MAAFGAINSSIDMRSLAAVQYAAPTTGSTVNVNTSGNIFLIINPAGTLLSLTIAFPSSPQDGDRVCLCSSQIVTTLTLSNGTIGGALTSLAVSTFASYVYHSTPAKWFRCG